MNDQVIKEVSLKSELSKLSSTAFCIVSPTSLSKMDCLSKETILNHYYVSTNDINYDLVSKQDFSKFTEIVGIGGGTAIDYAKYIAYNNKKPMIAIPSMLSTNVFATNKVAMVLNNKKSTVQGVLPDKIWVDYDYLSKSTQENLYGLVDVFSIFTASYDWKLANVMTELPMNSNIYDKSQKLLTQAISLAKTYGSKVPISQIFEVVTEAGYITNEYGSGRPESGSEHIFASAIETKMKIPHALAVSLGIFIMTYAFNALFKEEGSTVLGKNEVTEYFYFNVLGIINDLNKLELSYDFVYDILMNLTPREDKYTIVNLFTHKNFFEYNELKQYLVHNGLMFKD